MFPKHSTQVKLEVHLGVVTGQSESNSQPKQLPSAWHEGAVGSLAIHWLSWGQATQELELQIGSNGF